jgi:hypothetical protein
VECVPNDVEDGEDEVFLELSNDDRQGGDGEARANALIIACATAVAQFWLNMLEATAIAEERSSKAKYASANKECKSTLD